MSELNPIESCLKTKYFNNNKLFYALKKPSCILTRKMYNYRRYKDTSRTPPQDNPDQMATQKIILLSRQTPGLEEERMT